MCEADEVNEVQEACSFESLFIGQRFEWERDFSLQDTMAFGKLSGDHNPIYTSDTAAQARGLKAAVVHGVRVTFEVSRVCGAQFFVDGVIVSNMEARFKPMYHDTQYKFVLECESLHPVRGKKIAVFSFKTSSQDGLGIFGKVRLCFP